MHKHAVVIGGGISGLTVAHSLSLERAFKVTVLESSDRFGGVIRTLRGDSFHMEAGADAFDGREAKVLDLCAGLGLQDELFACEPTLCHVFISRGKSLLPVDLSDPLTIFTNPALSFPARARLLLEPMIPVREKDPDESLAGFAQRRFGKSFWNDVIRPLSRGILMAEGERLSLREYFPQWKTMERECGSVIKALLKKKNPARQPAPFFTVRGGMDRLTGALVKSLERADLKTRSEVASIQREKDWKAVLKDRRTIRADAICIAMPAQETAALLLDVAPALAKELQKLRYDPVIAVDMVFRREALAANRFQTGFMVPSRGKKWPFASLKLIGNTGDGRFAKCRAFISGVFQPEVFTLDDDKIKKEVLHCLAGEWKVQEPPRWISVERYPKALAQYETGHGKIVSNIENMLLDLPGLYLAGNGYHGFGISDCVRSAANIAEQMNDRLLIHLN